MPRLSRRAFAAVAAVAPFLQDAARAQTSAASDDARALIDLVFENYAYQERLTGFSERRLRALREGEAARVSTAGELVSFGERALAALFDHHAILNSSRANSYGLVPSFADMWIETNARGRYVIEDVRAGSPAAAAGIRPGDFLVLVEGEPVSRAIERFIEAPVGDLSPAQRAACARVLAAGRRDRARQLSVTHNGVRRRLALPNLYAQGVARAEGALTVQSPAPGVAHVRFNDSLGDDATIEAFDAFMRGGPGELAVIIDLRDTVSGGNTRVARAVLGWFVDRRTPYQRHELPQEARDGGPPRTWLEEVSPRGARYGGAVFVLVSRWTGSMGEGMALGFDAIGARVIGTRMAGLLGAVYDFPLPSSGIALKLPAERLYHVNGAPREAFTPPVLLPNADAPDASGADPALTAALRELATR
ncbi:MAG: hypothetical protein JNM59_01085 [Hyphomonadaceae bacterium]|nr:hypothetical protein [Hyphomonadaceae bacterium]